MKTITVRKDLTINTGNFSNVKVGAEITTDEMDWEKAWLEVNDQVMQQETLEKGFRLPSNQVKQVKEEKPLAF